MPERSYHTSMAVRHPPCRVAGRLTPRPIIYSYSHSALLLACESNLHPRKEGNISQPRSGVSARCLSTYSIHPCPPHAANEGRGRPITMLMHSRLVVMPSRDVAIHPTLAHTDTATVTSASLISKAPPPTQGHPRIRPAARRRCGCPAGKHEAPSSAAIGPTPRLFVPSVAARFMLPSTSLSSGIQVYLLSCSSICTQHA